MSIIVYGAPLSPYVRKVHAVAAEKGIAVELKMSPPGNPDPDFVACSPFRKIPAMRDGDFSICDSSAIVHYFEAIKPDPAMIPSEAKARARTIWLEELADTIFVSAAGAMFFNRVVAGLMGLPGNEEAAEKAEREALPPVMDYLESIVPAADGYLVEDRLTLADIAVASPFMNLRHMNTDLSRWPKTKAYIDTILARPSFTKLAPLEQRILGK
ncbi:MAG TPA: glutathione S-transferase family protein [Caulobacteraceae bacterium]